MKILHLTLKKKWFDMIASGEKKEEYREIKDFWTKRFTDRYELKGGGFASLYKKFDAVCFTNGYSPDSPRITVEWKGIGRDTGVAKWGAEPGKKYFVIKLGKRIK